MFDFIEHLGAPGRLTAQGMFGTPAGSWSTTPSLGLRASIDWPTAFWFPEAAAWLAQQLYEHYRFSGDLQYLSSAPIRR